MAAIDLMLDEENELTFQLNVEGSRPAETSARLLLNNKSMSLVFEAQKVANGEVSVILPPLKHVLSEGEYSMDLEVIVDDRYFKPLSIIGNFEKSIIVTAESIARPRRKKTNATASLIEVSKSNEPTKKRRPERIPHVEKIVETVQSNKEISDDEILNIIKALTSSSK